MGCDTDQPKRVVSVVYAYSSGSSVADLFFPAGPVMQTSMWLGARASLEIQATSDPASIEVSRAYTLSNDGITWDAPIAMTTDTGFVSAIGYSYGTVMTVVPASSQYVRFGFITNQKAGTAIEQIRVRYMLDRGPR